MPEALSDQLRDGFRATTLAELLALALGIGYALLAVRGDRRCWIFGGLSSALLAALAWRAALPMQGLLQATYVALSVYGWRRWTAGGSDAPPRVRRLRITQSLAAAALACAAGLAVAPWVAEWTHAAWPRLDSVTTIASLAATWMVARALIDNWIWWIVIDAVLAFLYFAQGLAFVALLYVAYLLIAIAGLVVWRRRLAA